MYGWCCKLYYLCLFSFPIFLFFVCLFVCFQCYLQPKPFSSDMVLECCISLSVLCSRKFSFPISVYSKLNFTTSYSHSHWSVDTLHLFRYNSLEDLLITWVLLISHLHLAVILLQSIKLRIFTCILRWLSIFTMNRYWTLSNLPFLYLLQSRFSWVTSKQWGSLECMQVLLG